MAEATGSNAGRYQAYVGSVADLEVDVLCVPVFGADDRLADLPWVDEATRGEVGRARSGAEFKSRLWDVFVTPVAAPGARARRIALIGAGDVRDLTAERWRRLGATSGYVATARAAASAGFVIRGRVDAAAAQHAADGFAAPAFDGATYKSAPNGPRRPVDLTIAAPGADAARIAEAVTRGHLIGHAANVARALANEPGNVLTPAEFADRVAAMARDAGLGVDVLDEARIRDLNMRLLLAVAQGSSLPPRVIVLRHEPAGAPASPVLALIGKGITFDTGGVSIKPADGMDRMKDDMAGGAAVAAAMLAIRRLGSPFHVIGIIPTAENAVGSRAVRPGDIVHGASGKSVEIINTDAEGRLVLADALWYAQQLGATHLVDVATLTGAITIALGRHVSGLFGRPAEWVDAVNGAATRAGDRVWPLPIYEEAAEQLRSEIADLINSAGRPGGSVTAAAFLQEFAGDRPWAHLDIAGTAWAETKETWQPKGATGVAVRTLIELGMTGGARPSTTG